MISSWEACLMLFPLISTISSPISRSIRAAADPKMSLLMEMPLNYKEKLHVIALELDFTLAREIKGGMEQYLWKSYEHM